MTILPLRIWKRLKRARCSYWGRTVSEPKRVIFKPRWPVTLDLSEPGEKRQIDTDAVAERFGEILSFVDKNKAPTSVSIGALQTTIMDWSPRSRTSNPRSRSPAAIARPVDYG